MVHNNYYPLNSANVQWTLAYPTLDYWAAQITRTIEMTVLLGCFCILLEYLSEALYISVWFRLFALFNYLNTPRTQ